MNILNAKTKSAQETPDQDALKQPRLASLEAEYQKRWVVAVLDLVKLTRQNRLLWNLNVTSPGHECFETQFNGRTVRLEKWLSSPSLSDALSMLAYRNTVQNYQSLKLSFFNEKGEYFSSCPLVPPLTALETAVRSQLGAKGDSLLNEIHKAAEEEIPAAEVGLPSYHGSREFKNHEEAQPVIGEFIRRSLKTHHQTVIRVIGVSMHFSWPFLVRIIDEYVEDESSQGSLKLEFVLSDESALWLDRHSEWKDRLGKVSSDIYNFKKDYNRYIDNGKISLTITSYRDFPGKHGLLIDDSILFVSYITLVPPRDGKRFEMRVGENRYRLFERGGERADHEIEQFNLFFDMYQQYGILWRLE